MDIFYKDTVNAGTLVVFKLPQIKGTANIFFFTEPAPTGRLGTFIEGAIITRVSYEQKTNSQFQQSLDNIIYVYSFGDQMGNLAVSGIVFPRICSSPSDNGIHNLMKFYREQRVSRAVTNVKVMFGNETIRGYLVGMGLDTLDTADGTHRFVLQLKTIPLAFNRGSPSETLAGDFGDTGGNQFA